MISIFSQGNDEFLEDFTPEFPFFTAARAKDYGFVRLVAHNATHLEIAQVSDDRDGEIIDYLWIVSEEHDFGFPK